MTPESMQFRSESSTSRMPMSGGGTSKSPSEGGGPQPRAGTQVVFTTTNYSIAPGPVWLELVNKTAFTASGTIKIEIPKWGGGQMLREGLKRPIAVAVVGQTIMPTAMSLAAQEEYEQKEIDKYADPDAKKKMQEAEKKQQQEMEKQQQEFQKQQEEKAKQEAEQQKGDGKTESKDAKAGIQPLGSITITPPLSTSQQASRVAELWLPEHYIHGVISHSGTNLTGMSPQGFPGSPQPISTLPALPNGVGIRYANIDTTVNPFELDIHFEGSGSVPAHSRWLIFTVTGV